MSNKTTTGCDRCDSFYIEISRLNTLLGRLEDKVGDSETSVLIGNTRADRTLTRAKLDEHISYAHRLALPF